MKASQVKFKDLALGFYGIAWATVLLVVYFTGPSYFEGVVVFGGLGIAVMNFVSLFLPDLTTEEVALALFHLIG